MLYLTGSVGAAARGVGISRASAYRLRAREDADGFAHEWDRVLAAPGEGRLAAPKRDWRKVTDEALARRVETGLVQPVIFRGRMAGVRWKADNTGLLRLLRRQDAVCRPADERGRSG